MTHHHQHPSLRLLLTLGLAASSALTLAACAPTPEPASAAPTASAEPTGVGLPVVFAPELPSLPRTIDFGPDYAGPALRTIVMADGLRVEVVCEGRGTAVAPGQRASVRFDGFASTDGAVVIGSHGQPTPVVLSTTASTSSDLHGAMVEAVTGMRVGERRRVHVPADLVALQAPTSPDRGSDVWINVELFGFDEVPQPAGLDAFAGPPIRSETLPDGLEIHDYALGEGLDAALGDMVAVHYILTLPDGTLVDSSHPRGQPFEVGLGKGMVIPGFETGLIGAKPGALRKIVVPPALAYGDRQVGSIPSHATLIFYLEILSVVSP